MSAVAEARPRRGLGTGAKRGILIGVIVVVIAFIALGTRVVPYGSEVAGAEQAFDPAVYGPEKFPEVRDAVVERAVEADVLAAAIADDKDAASAEYGVPSSGGTVFSVTMTGTFGEGASSIYAFDVDGLPDGLSIRVQTGPAINGTELRDATGDITFGEFTNQIDYQNAAASINDAMKAEVLEGLDTSALEGTTATITGAFTLINPEAWLVTPVSVEEG
ncbi:lipoprotein [Microbacterium sorbitolivorans]|uniref:DUF2291 family protein n=1 Tax=Microbacterium sorbitolivorans TaxID=1867410 RepID=UPI001651B067|nr:DUF2291 family protein [Microbacterium sorbitolivorans]GGF40388.1 lipoprotein [Microbacterium sorbitolivorans]